MSTKIIKINRGDSYEFPIIVPRKDDPSQPYFLDAGDPDTGYSGDALYFAIMYPGQRLEEAAFIEGYTHAEQNVKTGEIIIKIKPNATRVLTPGVYYYTAKLQRGGTLADYTDLDEPEEVRTIIERTKFIINE